VEQTGWRRAALWPNSRLAAAAIDREDDLSLMQQVLAAFWPSRRLLSLRPPHSIISILHRNSPSQLKMNSTGAAVNATGKVISS